MSFLRTATTQRSLAGVARFLIMGVAVVFPWIISPVQTSSLQLTKTYAITIAALVLFFLWLVDAVRHREIRVRRTMLDNTVLIGGVVLVASSIVSLLPVVSIFGRADIFTLHAVVVVALLVWSFLVVQYVHTVRHWYQVLGALLVGLQGAGLLFLFRPLLPAVLVSTQSQFQFFSSSQSVFAAAMALLAVMGCALLIPMTRSWLQRGAGLLSVVVGIAVLLRLGFTTGWVTLVIGTVVLLIMTMPFLQFGRVAAYSTTFACAMAAAFFLFFSTPSLVRMQLPVEVSLGAPASWDIVRDAVVDSPIRFLVGGGPGTFSQLYSLHRPPLFNASDVAWTIRFSEPYSAWFALLAEFGVLGACVALGAILLLGHLLFAAWKKSMAQVVALDPSDADTIRQLFVLYGLGAVWVTATLSLGYLFVDTAYWWLYGSISSLVLIGAATIVPSSITEVRYRLHASPQYAVFSSFLMIGVAAGMIFFSIFLTRWYLADTAAVQAQQAGRPSESRAFLEQATVLRPGYAPYLRQLAAAYFDQARRLAEETNPNGPQIVDTVARAINTGRRAADAWPADVENWQDLGLLYQGAIEVTPDAVQWSMDAFQQAIEREPTNPLLYWRLAQVQSIASQTEAAVRSLEQSVQLKGNYLPARIDLSRQYEALGELDRAIQIYQPVFSQIQQQPQVLFELGRLFYNRGGDGDQGRAEDVWLLAVQRDPTYANALYGLSVLYDEQGKSAQALEYATRAESVSPDAVTGAALLSPGA